MTSRVEYERQINWRLKQIMIGKASEAYKRFDAEFPAGARRRDHPRTPDAHDARMSKRQFEGRVKAWKRSVFELYPNDEQSSPRTSLNCNFFVSENELGELDPQILRARWINVFQADREKPAGRRSQEE